MTTAPDGASRMRVVFSKRDPTRLHEAALQSIRDAIVSGELRPGERLWEVALAEQMGISRGPVREALRQLEQEGLVTNVAFRGTFVTEFEREDVLELYALRLMCEAFALRTAMESGGLRRIDELRAITDRMAATEKTSSRDRRGRLSELDAAFHTAIVASAGLPRLQRVWTNVMAQIQALLSSGYPYADVAAHHRELAGAIDGGDPDAACAALTTHVTRARDRLLQQLDEESTRAPAAGAEV